MIRPTHDRAGVELNLSGLAFTYARPPGKVVVVLARPRAERSFPRMWRIGVPVAEGARALVYGRAWLTVLLTCCAPFSAEMRRAALALWTRLRRHERFVVVVGTNGVHVFRANISQPR